MKKRGALTSSQVILLILALTVLAVLVVFIARINYTGTIDKEACHDSVLLRANFFLKQLPEEAKPELQCKTERIEIKDTDEAKIKKRVADAMYDCWWMLGQGKLDFLGGIDEELLDAEGLGLVPVRSTCLICSVISFDDKLKQNPKNLDISDYIEKTKVPTKDFTYLEFFTEEEGALLPVETDVSSQPIKTDKNYAIVYFNFESLAIWEPIAKDLGYLGAGALTGSFFFGGGRVKGGLAKLFELKRITTGTRTVVNTVKLSETATLFTPKQVPIKTFVGLGRFIWPAVLLFTAYQTGVAAWDQHIAAGYCNGEKGGCQQIMLIPYNAASLSKVCQNVESIP